MTGADENDPRGSALRHIRNHLGPSWLHRLRPRDLDAAAEKRGGWRRSGNSLAPLSASAMPAWITVPAWHGIRHNRARPGKR